MLYVNTKQATRNLSMERETATRATLKEIAGGSQVASQRSQLVAQRGEQKKHAGEKSVGTLEAEYKATNLSDPVRWAANSQCEDVTAKVSGSFCTQVAQAKGRWEAGKERDRLDLELGKLPKALAVELTTTDGKTVEAPVVDAYVANIAALAKELGYQPTERFIKAEEVLSRAFSFELAAMLGPTAWLMLCGGLQHGSGHVAAAAARFRRRRKAKPQPADISTVTAGADEIDRCITRCSRTRRRAPCGRKKSGRW